MSAATTRRTDTGAQEPKKDPKQGARKAPAPVVKDKSQDDLDGVVAKLQQHLRDESNSTVDKYLAIGALVLDVRDNCQRFGIDYSGDAVKVVVERCGRGEHTIYNALRVVDAWSKEEIVKLVKATGKGLPVLSFAHLVEASKVGFKSQRAALIKKAVAEKLSTRALRSEVRKLVAATKPPRKATASTAKAFTKDLAKFSAKVLTFKGLAGDRSPEVMGQVDQLLEVIKGLQALMVVPAATVPKVDVQAVAPVEAPQSGVVADASSNPAAGRGASTGEPHVEAISSAGSNAIPRLVTPSVAFVPLATTPEAIASAKNSAPVEVAA